LVALDLSAQAVVLAQVVVAGARVAVDHQHLRAVRRQHIAERGDDGGIGHGGGPVRGAAILASAPAGPRPRPQPRRCAHSASYCGGTGSAWAGRASSAASAGGTSTGCPTSGATT